MSQALIRRFVHDLNQVYGLDEPIYEFGSLQVEPEQESDLRSLFAGKRFVGTDIRPGPGVDQVEDLRALSLDDGAARTVLCLDTLEHCADPVAACRELERVTARGGIAVISSVMLFGIHGYPNDYFRFTPDGFRRMLDGFDDVWSCGIGDPAMPFQVLGVAAKGRKLSLSVERLPSVANAQRSWEAAEGKVRIGPFRYGRREIVRLVAAELARSYRKSSASR